MGNDEGQVNGPFSLEDVLAGKAGNIPQPVVDLIRAMHAKVEAEINSASRQARALLQAELAAEYGRFVYRANRCRAAWEGGDQTKERCAKGYARETIAGRLCHLLADNTGDAEEQVEWQARAYEHKAWRVRWGGRSANLFSQERNFDPADLMVDDEIPVDEDSFSIADQVNKLLTDAGIMVDEGAVTPDPEEPGTPAT